MSSNEPLTIGQLASLACMLEVSAPKPGNVHRGADFEDVSLQDFLASAIAIQPVFDLARTLTLGELIFGSVQATAHVARSNTNLGMLLLMAPLAIASDESDLQSAAAEVVHNSDDQDAQAIYEAIRLANPGGMGQADQHDIADQSPPRILDAMKLAAPHDSIAKQYVTGFADLFDTVVPLLLDESQFHLPLSQRIVHAHVGVMASLPDTLIARKIGMEKAQHSAVMAQRVLDSGPPFAEEYCQQLTNLDFWLRCEGHKRNPGTTADLIAAGLFVCLIENKITAPFV